jgi:Uncharacterized anaerobic dehydrogenase
MQIRETKSSIFVNNVYKRRAISDTISTPYICGNRRLCRVCGRCVRVCPEQLIGKAGSFWRKFIVIENPESCIGCKQCIRVCPYGVFSEKMSGRSEDVI